jgi:hypothetical protein
MLDAYSVALLPFLLRIDGPNSQVTSDELSMLVTHAKRACTVIELGCYEGKTSVELARNTTGTVYSVDTCPPGRLGVCYGELIAKIHRRRRRAANLRFVKAASAEAARSFEGMLDIGFIDADHSYEGVKLDWEGWFPKVRKGGVIALHDSKEAASSPGRKGSMELYERDVTSMMTVQEIGSVGSLVVLRKL